MAQGRSSKIISMIKWIRTISFLIKNSLSVPEGLVAALGMIVEARREVALDGDGWPQERHDHRQPVSRHASRTTRWSTIKVNLLHAIDFRASCGADLVTLRSSRGASRGCA